MVCVFRAVFTELFYNSGLKGRSWQACEMPGLSLHAEGEMDGHYAFTWPLCTISSGFAFVMSQLEIVYSGCFWFL